MFLKLLLALCLGTFYNAVNGDNGCYVNAKPRRYDLKDLGYNEYFHGWVDVQGQGASNDYCRVVGFPEKIFLACALAGTHGENENNYKSIESFDKGYPNSWFMKDMDGDGRDDYCRCVGMGTAENPLRFECMKAGERGFYGSTEQLGSQYTFNPFYKDMVNCNVKHVRSDYGLS